MLGGKKVKYGGQTGIEVGTEVHFIHPETNATRAGVVERRDFTKVGDKKENSYGVRDFRSKKTFVVLQENVTIPPGHVQVGPPGQPILPVTPPGTPTASGRKRKTHKKKLRSKKRKTYTRR
jgi:hypothetical protein